MRDRPDSSADLSSIAVPTLLICGEQDELTPPSLAQATAREIPRSRLVIIPGAGHLAPMEKPGEVNQAIREFLQTL
jgi:pimeloyl-ACP methyl ester carboxylesterase